MIYNGPMDTEQAEDRWYTVDELAGFWKVNRETVRRWIRTRQLTALELGKKAGYRVSLAEVARFQGERMRERTTNGAE